MGAPQQQIPMGYIQGPRGLAGMTVGGAPMQGWGSVLPSLPNLPVGGGPGSGVIPNTGPGYYGQPSGMESMTGPSLGQQFLGGTDVGHQYGIPDVSGAVTPAGASWDPTLGQGGGFDWGSLAGLMGGGGGQSQIPGAPLQAPRGMGAVGQAPRMVIDPQTGLIKWA